jgi:hypothetical protein
MGLFVLVAALVAERQVVASLSRAKVFDLLVVMVAIHYLLSIVINK